MSGQAIMAAIDTAMVLAVQTTLPEPRIIHHHGFADHEFSPADRNRRRLV